MPELLRRLYFPSPRTDSWICSRVLSILGVWLWLELLGLALRLVFCVNRVRVSLRFKISVQVNVSVNMVTVRMGTEIAPIIYICPSRTENNTERVAMLCCDMCWTEKFRMVVVRPLRKSRVVKKRTKKFIRHQSDRYVKLKVFSSYGHADTVVAVLMTSWWEKL